MASLNPMSSARPRERQGAAELLVLLSALVVMLAGFLFALNAVRLEAALEFDRRAQLVDSYLQSRRQALDVLARDFRRHYAGGAPLGPGRVKTDAPHKAWMLPGAAPKGGVPAAAATGALPFGAAAQRELGALLALDAGMRSVLVHDRDVARVSYLSSSRFVYLQPAAPTARFRFSEGLYAESAWTQAQPAQNPAGEMVVGGPRNDAAGSGQVFTLGVPLLQRQQLLGMLALELRPEVLRLLLARQGAVGDFLLVNSAGQVVVRAGAFRPGDTWPAPRAAGRHRDDNGAEWTVAPVADGRLFLLQRLGVLAQLKAAAQRSLPAGLLVVMLALVAILSLRLRQALALVALHSHRDPLTRALTRRGLYEGAEGLRALATRSRKPLAVVMFDIDAFKKVNAAQGHERGDKVLVALANGLQHQVRDYDVLCRWSGEEFLAVLMLETGADAIPVAERLRNVAATACLREALTLVTISAGMAIWQQGEALDAAIARADQSLMAAKAGGRDRLDVSVEVAAAVAN